MFVSVLEGEGIPLTQPSTLQTELLIYLNLILWP
jgi:hypothetical protein